MTATQRNRPMGREPSLRRRMTRRWPQILLFWLVASLALLYVIYQFIPPTYEAFSMLQVEPGTPKLFGKLESEFGDYKGIGPYLQTQVVLLTTGRVLKEVIASSSIQQLPTIADSQDPEADLRKKIDVQIVDEAFLIRVALELPN